MVGINSTEWDDLFLNVVILKPTFKVGSRVVLNGVNGGKSLTLSSALDIQGHKNDYMIKTRNSTYLLARTDSHIDLKVEKKQVEKKSLWGKIFNS